MSNIAAEVAARMRADGIDPNQTPAEAFGEQTPVEGTGRDPAPQTPPAAAPSTPDREPGGGPPETIPYSRFAEVNAEKNALQQKWGVLEQYGIEPDSAVRLASFEAAYMQDPQGTISGLVDQLDLPDSQKSAVKALLSSAAAQPETPTPEGERPAALPAEVKEVVDWVQAQKQREVETESQSRLDFVVNHWRSLDAKDNIQVPERQRLMYIQTAAAAGGFQTLEQLAELARGSWLEDRDANLGGVIQRPRTGSPLSVPSSGVPPTQPVVPKTMAEARKLIQADIEAGRIPDLSP